MFKKFLISMGIVLSGCTAFALTQYNDTFKGFQNIEFRQKLNVINRLQAIADNDGVEFSKFWPAEYFQNNENISSFIYLAKNEQDSLDIIKFDIINSKENCFDPSTLNYCIPSVKPNIASYVYNERLIIDYTPDFVNHSEENIISEVLLKDGKYFDTKPIRSTLKEPPYENTLTECETSELSNVSKCTTIDSITEDVLYTEEFLLKDSKRGMVADNVIKYKKYNPNGQKIQEYIYATGRHSFYNENGDLIEFAQYNENKFKYFNTKLPDLYIDMEITKDTNGNIIKEVYYDRNNKVARKYTAEYKGNEIQSIRVYDMYKHASWEIIPIVKSQISQADFSIRH